VCRHREQVDLQLLQVDLDLSGRLPPRRNGSDALGAAISPISAIGWITPISLFTS